MISGHFQPKNDKDVAELIYIAKLFELNKSRCPVDHNRQGDYEGKTMSLPNQPSKIKPLLIALGVIGAIVFIVVGAPQFVRSLSG